MKRTPDMTDAEWDQTMADRKRVAEDRMRAHDEGFCQDCPWLSEGGCTAARCVREGRK